MVGVNCFSKIIHCCLKVISKKIINHLKSEILKFVMKIQTKIGTIVPYVLTILYIEFLYLPFDIENVKFWYGLFYISIVNLLI